MSTAALKHNNLVGVLSESDSKPIIKSHFRYYLCISLLYLFSISSFLFKFLQATLQATEATLSEIASNHIQSFLGATIHSYDQIKTLAIPVAYSLFLLILIISAVGTIVYSIHHGFYRTPLKLIKFFFCTLTSLAAASLVSEVIVILIALASVIFVGLVNRGIELLLVYENIDSDYFTGLVCGVFLMIFMAVVLYVQVNWSFASVIFVVVESSKWGFEPVRRSKDLVREMRGVFLLIMCVYGFIIGGGLVISIGGFSYGWKSLVFLVQSMVGPIFVPMFMRFYMAAFGVLYVYCKVMRGDFADQEAARESVSLPSEDHEKVPDHVVDVDQA